MVSAQHGCGHPLAKSSIVVGTMDFSGLTIPDGGMHIVGGKLGEAFIVLPLMQDARAGMMYADGISKRSKVIIAEQ